MKKTIKLLLVLILFASIVRAVPAGDPTAASFSVTATTNFRVGIQLQGAQVDGHTLTYAITTNPTHGSVTGLNSTTGFLVYQSVAAYTGTDTIGYTVTANNTGGSPITTTEAAVTITVTNQKTTIHGCLVNPDATPAAGIVTWQLVQAATSSDGFIPAGNAVTGTLDSSGCYLLSLYPSTGLSPQGRYILMFKASSGLQQQQIGVFSIPQATGTISQGTLATYQVVNLSASAPYIIPNISALDSFINSISAGGTFIPGNITLGSGLSGSGLSNAVNGAGTAINLASTVVRTDQANVYGTFKQTFKTGTNFDLVDPSDVTKIARFDLSGITTGNARTVTVANGASTTVIADTGASNNFLTAISAAGVISRAQPSFTNISGSVAATQMPALTGDVTTSAGAVATTIGAGKVTNAMLAGSIDLTVKVTGVLPVANGGSGANTLTGILKGNGTSAFTAATAGTDYVTGSSTNTFTNKTFDTAGTGNSFKINGVSITTTTGSGTLVASTQPALFNINIGQSANGDWAITGGRFTDTSPTGDFMRLTNNGGGTVLWEVDVAGTVLNGIWHGTAIDVAHGGSGAATLTGILKGNGTSAFTAVTAPSGAIIGDTDSQTLTNKTLTSPVIANIAPGADFTVSQNSVAPFKSVNSGAIVDTLRLDSGIVLVGTTASKTSATSGSVVLPNNVFLRGTTSAGTNTRGLIALNSSNLVSIDANALGIVTGAGMTMAANSSLGFNGQNIALQGQTGILKVTDGSTGVGPISYSRLVSAKTANYTVVNTDTNAFFTNTGAAGEVDFTLPSAAAGLTYVFYVDTAQTLKIIAGASTTIRIAGSVSASAGNVTNATVGGCIRLTAVATNAWIAEYVQGTWTVN